MPKPAKRRAAPRPKAKAKEWGPDNRMGNRYTVGFNDDENATVTVAAKAMGTPVATWIRIAALEKARREQQQPDSATG